MGTVAFVHSQPRQPPHDCGTLTSSTTLLGRSARLPAVSMNKNALVETNIRSKSITPAIVDVGWDLMAQIAEQKRVPEKVCELMALVDQLEAQQAAARTTAEKLLEAAVAELTEMA